MKIEIRPEAGNHTGAVGHRVWIDGVKGNWHYGPSDRTTISIMQRHIQAYSKDGGEIIDYDTYNKKPKIHIVDPCPTNHANLSDDFMGGTVCLDCRAVW